MPEQADTGSMLGGFGIGVDIESIDRLRKMDVDLRPSFMEKILAVDEMQGLDTSVMDPDRQVMSRFSAKEAIMKALSSTGIKNVHYHDIVIRHDEDGTPRVELSHPRYKGIEVKLSVSHSAGLIIAFAIATRGPFR
ncbi:MAG: 4'-phosphopantetheinyl transferase superfamily protein [Candidatus Lokiarchaeota archaeon]|nr:4'-phosphopantetheinyl transferase superfamily protein [Candidatus Lokiarchaeota archaeon]